MEGERLYTKQPSRTIQQKCGGEGALEMVDNRPAGILQAMSEHPIQRVEDDEDTLQGTDIHIAPGQERHLPHEAWHVAQQMAGRVEPTTEIGGMPVNDNAALEHEADVMGARANHYRRR